MGGYLHVPSTVPASPQLEEVNRDSVVVAEISRHLRQQRGRCSPHPKEEKPRDDKYPEQEDPCVFVQVLSRGLHKANYRKRIISEQHKSHISPTPLHHYCKIVHTHSGCG